MNIALGIIILTVVVSLIGFSSQEILRKLMLIPYEVHHRKQYQRLFTHTLVHADFFHLLVNMYVMYSFGTYTEMALNQYFGSIGIVHFLVLYIGGGLFSALPSIQKHKNHFSYQSLGASGAVASILFSSIVLNPWAGIYLFFIPIPIPAFIFGILYLVYEAYMDKKGGDYVAHDAHFFGALFGLLYTLLSSQDIAMAFIDQLFNR